MLFERASGKLENNAHLFPRKVSVVANHDRSVKPEASLLGLVGPKRPLKASPRGLLVSANLDEFISNDTSSSFGGEII